MGYISVEWMDTSLWGGGYKAIAMKEEAFPFMSSKVISLYIMSLNQSIFITVPLEILKPEVHVRIYLPSNPSRRSVL